MDAPSWFKGAHVGDRSGHWRVVAVENRGRILRWSHNLDGRVARSEITPAHPDYPKDPTPEQLRQEGRDAAAARKRALRGH